MNTSEGQESGSSNVSHCPICCDIFTEPKIIPCGHVICRSCLVSWLNVRRIIAGCPLCRYPIQEVRHPGYQIAALAEMVADAIPTDLITKATVRGRHDVTPVTCLGCEGLLCPSRTSSHPLCPGQQDPQETVRREAKARATMKAQLQKVRDMVATTLDLQAFLRDTEVEFHGLADLSETVALLRLQAVQLVAGFHNPSEELRTVLLTHQHLLERLQDSRQVVATILMEEAVQERVESLGRKMESLQGMVFYSLFVTRQRLGRPTSRPL